MLPLSIMADHARHLRHVTGVAAASLALKFQKPVGIAVRDVRRRYRQNGKDCHRAQRYHGKIEAHLLKRKMRIGGHSNCTSANNPVPEKLVR